MFNTSVGPVNANESKDAHHEDFRVVDLPEDPPEDRLLQLNPFWTELCSYLLSLTSLSGKFQR